MEVYSSEGRMEGRKVMRHGGRGREGRCVCEVERGGRGGRRGRNELGWEVGGRGGRGNSGRREGHISKVGAWK